MKLISKTTVIIALIANFSMTLSAFAQRASSNTKCSLVEARDFYKIGQFIDLKNTIKCFLDRTDTNRNTRNQAKELLALTAIAEDSIAVAKAQIKDIVLSDANYTPQSQNVVFQELYQITRNENIRVTITSVSKKPEDIRTAPASVVLVEGKDIIARGYQDIIDLLADVAGFEISKIHSVLYANIFQLGFRQENTERTLLMIDGVEQNDMWLNWAYLSRQYPLSNIKGVEIVYGPSSTMYGPRAFVGAINIITYGSKEKAGNYFESNNKDHNYYTHGSLTKGSFNTKNVDLTVGNTSKDSKLNFQITTRYFYSDEHDMSEDPFYNYNSEDLNKFEYEHLNFYATESNSVQDYLNNNNLNTTSPYYNVSENSIELTPEGQLLALTKDKEIYSGLVNGNKISYSNHSEDFFVGFKITIDKLLIGFNQWKRTEGFNFYQDVDVAPSKSGSVWSPENRTIYLKYDNTFSEHLSISVQSSFKNHKLGKESNRVNFFPFGKVGSLDLADLINYDDDPTSSTYTQHGWRNRYYFYQAQQGRTEIRLYYNKDNVSLVWGNDYRLTSTQGDYLTYMDYQFRSPSEEAYQALQSDVAFAMENGTVNGQNQGSNMFLVQDMGSYLQGNIKLGDKFHLSGGVRYDKNIIRYSDGFSVITPRLGLLYNSELSTIKLNYSRGFQNVSLFTRYSTGGGRVPNPDIEPEAIDYIDLSIMGNNKSKKLKYSLTGFDYSVNNAVTSMILENGRPQNTNAGKYHILGAMANLSYRTKSLRFDLNSTYFKPFELKEDGSDLRIGDIASFRANLGLTKFFESKSFESSLNLRLNYVGEKQVGPETTQSLNLGLDNSNIIPAYTTLNGNFLFRIKSLPSLSFGVSAYNILDKKYYHPGPRTAAGYFDLENRNTNDSYSDFLNNSLWNKNTPYILQRPRNIQLRLIFDF